MSRAILALVGRLWWLPPILLATIALPAALLDTHSAIRISDDALDFHLPQINHFILEPFDLVDYPPFSATLPGYHAIMAWIARLLGQWWVADATPVMRIVNALFPVAAVALAIPLARRARRQEIGVPALAGDSVLLLLPFALSWYMAYFAVYYSTDGLAILLTSVVLWSVLAPQPRALTVGLALAALMFVRQLYAPLLVVAALLPARLSQPFRTVLTGSNLRFAAMAIAPALILFAVYIFHWRGLVPPGVTAHINRSGLFPHSWLHALSLMGLYAVLFLPLEAKAPRGNLFRGVPLLVLAGLLFTALLLSVGAESTYSQAMGRWGSVVWTLAQRSPAMMERSLAVPPMALLGAAFLAYLFARAWRRDKVPPELTILVLFLLGTGLTQTAHQRFVEPLALLCLGIFFHRIARAERPPWVYLPLAGYAAFSLAGSLWRLYDTFRPELT